MKGSEHSKILWFGDCAIFSNEAFYEKSQHLESFSFESLLEVFKSSLMIPKQDMYYWGDDYSLLEAIFKDFVVDLFATCLLNDPSAYRAVRTAQNIFEYPYSDSTLATHLDEYYNKKNTYDFWDVFYKSNVKKENTGYKISTVGGAAILISMEFEYKEKIPMQSKPENSKVFFDNYAVIQNMINNKISTWKNSLCKKNTVFIELTNYFLERLWHLNYIYDLLEILNNAKNSPPFIPAKTEFEFNYDFTPYSPNLFKNMLMWSQNSSLLANQYIIKNILRNQFQDCIQYPSRYRYINEQLIPSLTNCLISYVESRYEGKDAPTTAILEDCTPYATEILKNHYKLSQPRIPFKAGKNETLTYYLQDIYSSIYGVDKTSRNLYSLAET